MDSDKTVVVKRRQSQKNKLSQYLTSDSDRESITSIASMSRFSVANTINTADIYTASVVVDVKPAKSKKKSSRKKYAKSQKNINMPNLDLSGLGQSWVPRI